MDEPIYGDEHTLWERLKKAEAALRSRQAKARDYYVDRQSARQQALREGLEPDVRYVPVPQMPDTEEVERHLITHIPPAPWCEYCARGHASDEPHRRHTVDQKLVDNHVELDYSFLKTDTGHQLGRTLRGEQRHSALDCRQWRWYGIGLEHSRKESRDAIYVVRVITSFITQLGYTTVKLRSDNEPAIKKVVAKIAAALREGKAPGAAGLKIIFEEVPRYSSQSLGHMGFNVSYEVMCSP